MTSDRPDVNLIVAKSKVFETAESFVLTAQQIESQSGKGGSSPQRAEQTRLAAAELVPVVALSLLR